MKRPRTRERIAAKLSSEPEAKTTSARENAISSRAAWPPGQVTTARQAPRSGSTRARERANSSGKREADEEALTKVADFTKSAKITPSSPAPGKFPAKTWVMRFGP